MTRTWTTSRQLAALAGAAILIVTAAAIVAAQGPEPRGPGFGGPLGRGHGGPGGMFLGGGLLGEATLRPFARALDLTDEQRDRIQAIVASRKDAFEALRERAQPAREALRAAMVATPIDESAIRARIAELSQTGADLAVLGAQVRAEVRDVLTDAQRTTLEELQKTARPRGPRFGEGRGTRPGAR